MGEFTAFALEKSPNQDYLSCRSGTNKMPVK